MFGLPSNYSETDSAQNSDYLSGLTTFLYNNFIKIKSGEEEYGTTFYDP